MLATDEMHPYVLQWLLQPGSDELSEVTCLLMMTCDWSSAGTSFGLPSRQSSGGLQCSGERRHPRPFGGFLHPRPFERGRCNQPDRRGARSFGGRLLRGHLALPQRVCRRRGGHLQLQCGLTFCLSSCGPPGCENQLGPKAFQKRLQVSTARWRTIWPMEIFRVKTPQLQRRQRKEDGLRLQGMQSQSRKGLLQLLWPKASTQSW